ncbi:MAG: gliding motility-associated ABC transporter substrate-binding protein GldG [Bacteroidetes bacterium MedPE-SWsnd-G2]|nr:MAG: gliding motility-associated ABC transporter substrate-binding protein GldG [Bacteroidetes bacterium MedPE-SWsnd-G2]
MNNLKSTPVKALIALVLIVIVNIIGQSFYGRFDMTKDKRYTLSEASKNTVSEVNSPLVIDVFLEGDFPSEFRRLQTETKQLLEEFNNYNDEIIFNFVNPIEDEATRDANIQSLVSRGMQPRQLNVQKNGKTSQELIFPWALASYNNNTVIINLIKNKIGVSTEELVSNSVQQLEYAFADGFNKLVSSRSKKIAILKGNGQLDDVYMADFLTTIKDYYFIAPFTLDSVASNPKSTLKTLNNYDLILSAQPSQPFSEEEKYVLDQYTMNGGKSIWLTDGVFMDKDSLLNDTGKGVALPKDLNLNDFFFKYGVRINNTIVKDMYSAPIALAIGEGSQAQIQPIQWQYSPLAAGNPTHPITKNINLIKFDFASPIDTLKNSLKQTVIIQSSKLTGIDGVPKIIDLAEVTKTANPQLFNKGVQNLGVLIEGEFTSVYNNRVKPLDLQNNLDKSVATKMIVISDGDVIKNDVVKGKPQELGFDRWTGQSFGNKEVLVNAVNYLLDNSGLINIRNREIKLAYLNPEKIEAEKGKWQSLNILLPLVLLGIFGFGFAYFRRKKYSK